jgi:hypothetical protein
MKRDLQNAELAERFEHLRSLISSQRFLKKQGQLKEVPFFICPYRAEEACEMEPLQARLKKKLEQSGVRVLAINLYDLTHEILVREGDWEWAVGAEQGMPKDDFRAELQSILDVENVVVPEIANQIGAHPCDVLFLSGVGEVFPYIRSHNVLNNLQRVAKEQPTVLFFPGEYTHSLQKGASLDLFGRLHDDKYYRAFNIYGCEP